MIRRTRSFLTLGAALLLGACATPLGGNDVDLSIAASALPGAGVTLGFAQRMSTLEGGGRYDLEVEWSRHALDEATNAQGNTGDTLNQIRLGVRWRPAAWSVRAGAVWMRAQGDPVYLDDADDYGGMYVGAGYEFRLGKHMLTGPDATLSWVRPEGSGDSGLVPQIAWRLVWKL